MATRYVRKSGSDSNGGTSPSDAWLTIGKALGAAGISSGDTVYVGAGVYREAVTVAMTSAVAETKVIGDVSGAYTGDAGEVQLSVYTTNDRTAPASSSVLTLAGRDYLTFEDMSLIGGGGTLIAATSSTSTNITFRRCFIAATSSNNIWQGPNPATVGNHAVLFDSCISLLGTGNTQGYLVRAPLNPANVDYDMGYTFKNCLFIGATGAVAIMQQTVGGSGTGKAGGVKVHNCTMIGGGTLLATNNGNASTTIPCEARNCLHIGGSVSLNANAAGQIVEDYCVLLATTARTNVTAGANSAGGVPYPYAPLLEFGQAILQGRNPRSLAEPTSTSPFLGFGSDAAVSLTEDMIGGARPAGGSSASKAVGALERGNTAAQETTTVRTGSNAGKITGPGYQDYLVPVDATSTTISVYLRKDGSYAGTAPQLQVLAQPEIGVTAASDTMTASANTWDQRSLTFTPTAKGVVTIRILSSSTAGGGVTYFDDFAVT